MDNRVLFQLYLLHRTSAAAPVSPLHTASARHTAAQTETIVLLPAWYTAGTSWERPADRSGRTIRAARGVPAVHTRLPAASYQSRTRRAAGGKLFVFAHGAVGLKIETAFPHDHTHHPGAGTVRPGSGQYHLVAAFQRSQQFTSMIKGKMKFPKRHYIFHDGKFRKEVRRKQKCIIKGRKRRKEEENWDGVGKGSLHFVPLALVHSE